MRTKLHWIAGIIQFVSGILWAGLFIHQFYLYHFTNRLFFIILPDWYIVPNSLLGILNAILGIRLIIGSILIKKAYTIFFFCILANLLIIYF
ncbi:MAG: hypothetical protein K1X81_03015 [Bacteroidia bacterium]|nr:hypothetical protein [Bacteroidia bacterium]